MRLRNMRLSLAAAGLIGLTGLVGLNPLTISESQACTRVVYQGPDNTIITGRTMDFSIDIPANLWAFPRGMTRHGEVGPNSISWTSRYGSIAASSWDIATPDGMNEKGLVANLLWLVDSEYPVFNPKGDKPGLTIAAWAQYALDNFATVAEAVTELGKEEFVIVTDFIPGTDKFTTVHLSLSDATGDSAIFEYVGGELVIHHDRTYQVMTNDPVYEQQLAIQGYWDTIPGTIMLPGSNRAADRFVRAAYYINAIPQTTDTQTAIASVFSVIRNVSVPYGISTPNQPHISNTRWRSVSDQRNKVYYFENVLTPSVLWVDLKQMDLSEGAPVKKLTLDHGPFVSGKANDLFEETEPFKFQGLD
ncbi:linear amide C-N hydrolase [Thiomicrospira sp. ALE5]|uniref:linear amide C-N hydrolase n=1 Tax=Thiomicrospira sp. ALE5 TaxID=748650 RepID=UPI0008E6D2BB|nr:linear amide C-N hydrolase [Thiomicrospira sp. ALE5]SFR50924.1 choloylglycine hydrolase [Thiomicrospira sp. ALE5]